MGQSDPGKLVNAGLLKLRYVLNIARKDRRFLNDISRNAYQTIAIESGIDLSTGEVMALMDIFNETSNSTMAPFLQEYRDYWRAINEDRDFKFSDEDDQNE